MDGRLLQKLGLAGVAILILSVLAVSKRNSAENRPSWSVETPAASVVTNNGGSKDDGIYLRGRFFTPPPPPDFTPGAENRT